MAEQVGVYAPGRPKITTFFPLVRSSTFTAFGPIEQPSFSTSKYSISVRDLERVYDCSPSSSSANTSWPAPFPAANSRCSPSRARSWLAHRSSCWTNRPWALRRSSSDIFHIIARIREAGNTVLLVEQNARSALKIANRGYVLETGRIILEGDAEDLWRTARSSGPIWARTWTGRTSRNTNNHQDQQLLQQRTPRSPDGLVRLWGIAISVNLLTSWQESLIDVRLSFKIWFTEVNHVLAAGKRMHGPEGAGAASARTARIHPEPGVSERSFLSKEVRRGRVQSRRPDTPSTT